MAAAAACRLLQVALGCPHIRYPVLQDGVSGYGHAAASAKPSAIVPDGQTSAIPSAGSGLRYRRHRGTGPARPTASRARERGGRWRARSRRRSCRRGGARPPLSRAASAGRLAAAARPRALAEPRHRASPPRRLRPRRPAVRLP